MAKADRGELFRHLEKGRFGFLEPIGDSRVRAVHQPGQVADSWTQRLVLHTSGSFLIKKKHFFN
mgnify:CR=1